MRIVGPGSSRTGPGVGGGGGVQWSVGSGADIRALASRIFPEACVHATAQSLLRDVLLC